MVDTLNDTKLVGAHQLITLDTAQYALHLVSEFQNINHPSKTFRKDLFDPLWQRLKEQGCNDQLTKSNIKAKKRNVIVKAGKKKYSYVVNSTGTTKFSNISWRSERNTDKLSIYNWVHVPPTSTFGQDKKKATYVSGVDYYNSEEHLVHDVLQEISTLDELSDLYAANVDYFSSIMPILDKAVSQGIDYKNAAASVLEDGDKKMSAKRVVTTSKRNRDDDMKGVSEVTAGRKKKKKKKSGGLSAYKAGGSSSSVVLPSPRHGQYYTKSEAISVITQYPKGSTERALAIEGVKVKGYVPISTRNIYKLLRKDEQGIPIDDSPWKEVEGQSDDKMDGVLKKKSDQKLAADDPEWENNFNDLVQYKKKYGNSQVPRNWSGNPKLAAWVHVQRKHSIAHIFEERQKHLITAEKIATLNSIGFAFYVQHTDKAPQNDAYLSGIPQALDVASTEDAAESTGKAVKSNLPDVPTLYMPIDVCDTGLLWNCARIVKIEKNKKAISGITHYVTVHYEGWPSDWDEPMSWPSILMAERYTYTKKAKCFIKLDGIKDSWPCKIYFRMPHTDKKEPRDFLRKEKRVYIEPYMPTLLPTDVKKGLIDQRGQWTTVGRIKSWRDFMPQLEGSQSDPSFESSLSQAHKEAQADRKVSKLPLNALSKGVLIRDEYHTKREGGDPHIITDGVICQGGFDTSIKIEHKYKKLGPTDKTGRPWGQRFIELKEYKKQFGNANVPSDWAENPQLATWVNSQRRYLRKYVDNEDGAYINLEKIRKLLSVGFVFNPQSNHPKSEAFLRKMESQINEENEDKGKKSSIPLSKEAGASSEGKIKQESDGEDSLDNPESTSKVVTRGTTIPQVATTVPQVTTRRAALGLTPTTLPPPILINDIIYPNQGVRRQPGSNGWAAVLKVAGNDIFLGSYTSQTEVVHAVRLAKEKSSRGSGQVNTSSAPSPFARRNAGQVTDIMNMPIESIVTSFEKAQQAGYEPSFNLQDYMSQRRIYVKHRSRSEYERDHSYLIDVKLDDGNVSNKRRKKSVPKRLVGGL